MDRSTSAQAGSGQGGTGPDARGAASTLGQRAALAERLQRHVLALEGVRHPVAAPERHRAARDGEPDWPAGFEPARVKKYGDTAVFWAEYAAVA